MDHESQTFYFNLKMDSKSTGASFLADNLPSPKEGFQQNVSYYLRSPLGKTNLDSKKAKYNT